MVRAAGFVSRWGLLTTELTVPVSQLRHMLPTGESGEMPDEDEDEPTPGEILQGVRFVLV